MSRRVAKLHNRKYYHNRRAKYNRPRRLTLVFIAESPPASGRYFYDASGKVTEPLFRAMMRDVLGISPATKAEGLAKFAKAGYLLVDATYTPVNQMSNKERNARILKDYSRLREDLHNLLGRKRTKIILTKANICRLLESRLREDGFNVINRGVVVPFPAFGQQKKFRQKLRQLLRRAAWRLMLRAAT